MSNAGAAQALRVAVKSVSKWRRLFAEQRLAGLRMPRRSGGPGGAGAGGGGAGAADPEARQAKTAQHLAMRAKIVLACVEGRMNKEVVADLGVNESTVDRWRARFITRRLDGLQDEPRPGRPPSILLDQVEEVIVATLESSPGKDTHWSRALMTRHRALSAAGEARRSNPACRLRRPA